MQCKNEITWIVCWVPINRMNVLQCEYVRTELYKSIRM